MDSIVNGYIPHFYFYVAQGNGGKIALPMSGQALYTNFSHMSGIAAEGGTVAYNIDMLHVLDLLIGQLDRIRSQPHEAAGAHAGLSAERVDALIQQYGSEVHDLATAPAKPYAAPAPSSFAEPGKLFSLAA
jgi:hypothetical protein